MPHPFPRLIQFPLRFVPRLPRRPLPSFANKTVGEQQTLPFSYRAWSVLAVLIQDPSKSTKWRIGPFGFIH